MEAFLKFLIDIYRAHGVEGIFAVSGWVFAVLFPMLVHYFYTSRLVQVMTEHQAEIGRYENRWRSVVDATKDNEKRWRSLIDDHQKKLVEVVTDVTRYNTILVEKLSVLQSIMISLMQNRKLNGTGKEDLD